MLEEKDGHVSIWAGTLAKKAELTAYLKETHNDDDETPISRFAADCGETFYDHDQLESGHAAKAAPLGDLLAGYSYTDSFAAEAVKLGKKCGLTTANTVILAYDLVLQPKRWPKDALLTHLGALPYSQIAVPKHQPLEKVRGHKQRVMRIEFAPQGRLVASGCAVGTLLAWDGESGCAVSQLQGALKNGVYGLAFSADGRRLFASSTGQARVWKDFPAPKSLGPAVERSCHVMDAEGNLAYSAKDSEVWIFDLESGVQRGSLPIPATGLHWLAKDVLLGTRYDRLLTIWDCAAGRQVAQFHSPLPGFDEVAPAAGGRWIVAYHKGQLAGYDVARSQWSWTAATAEGVRTWDPGTGNQGLVAGARLEIWQWNSGQRVREFGTPGLVYWRANLSADDRLALVIDNDGIAAELWDADRGVRLARVAGESLGADEMVSTGQIGPDNKTIALGTYSGRVVFFLWDGKKLAPVRPL